MQERLVGEMAGVHVWSKHRWDRTDYAREKFSCLLITALSCVSSFRRTSSSDQLIIEQTRTWYKFWQDTGLLPIQKPHRKFPSYFEINLKFN